MYRIQVNLKVVSSIPDEIIYFFTMTLGSIEPLTEMNTRNVAVAKRRPARKADVAAICEPIV
jgi:hypothetical protein